MGYDERYEKIRTALLKRRFYLGLSVFLPVFFSMFALATPLIFLTKLKSLLRSHLPGSYELAEVYRSAEQWTYIFAATAFITGLVVAYGLVRPAKKLLTDSTGDVEEFASLGKEFTKIAVSFRNYSHLIGSTTGGIMALGKKGEITMANPYACFILGRPESDLVGRDLRKFFDISKDIEKAMRGETVTSELSAAISNEPRTIGYAISPVRSGGRIDGAVLTFIDTTKIKEMQAEMQKTEKLASIGALAMEVAHEVRNPLASIKGLVQLIGEDIGEGNPKKSYIDLILKETDRLNRVVDSIFEKRATLTEGESLRDTIHRIVLLCGQAVKGKIIRISEEYDDAAGNKRLQDDRLFYAVYNIVLNAYEAVRENSGIYIRTKTEAGGTIIEVSSDSELAPGISAERIFDLGVTTKGAGHGMGLKIARDAIKNAGGDISVDVEDGKTKFIIKLP